MAITQIADLWVPAVWIQEMREKQATFPALFNSGIVTRTPRMDEIASGPGTSVNLPFFKDVTDQADAIQIENTAPATVNNQPSGLQIGVPLNRETQNSATALAAQVSGSDPVGSIISQMLPRRLKQRQSTLIALLRGSFASDGAPNAAAALSAVRVGGTTAEPFIEDGNAATGDNLVSPDMFIDAGVLLGELEDELKDGCLLVHPVIKARLRKLDALNFKTTVMPSELPWTIQTYRDIPIFTSAALARVGTTSGFVYDSYLIVKGAVGYGEKPQAGDVVDVASLSYWLDKTLNAENIFDRTRSIVHLNGMKWVGTPGGQSATNAELQTAANWNLVYQTANRVGAACFRTNG